TRYRDRRTVNQLDAGITGADHRRNAQFTGDDGRMAGAPATIGDNGGGALHDRFPIRIGHIRNQDVAGLDTVHFGDRLDVAHFAGADALADGAAFGQNVAARGLDPVALQGTAVAALYRFRARLQDVQLAGLAVLAPFNVHGAAI